VTQIGAYELDTVQHCDALTLLKGLPDGSADAIITDPPYGVGRVSGWRSVAERFTEIVGNDDVYTDWLLDANRVLSDIGALYVFANWQNVDAWKAAIRSAGFHVRNLIVWDKMQTGAGDPETCYAPEYELILFSVKGRHVLRGSRPSDIIHCPKVPPNALLHPYEKPVGLLERLVLKSSDVGGVVVDCFAGSGATLQAAAKNERHWLGSEVDMNYVELANKRLALPFTPYMFAPQP
jgi:site-specific DNA-methyltransferase (adenine-specific)